MEENNSNLKEDISLLKIDYNNKNNQSESLDKNSNLQANPANPANEVAHVQNLKVDGTINNDKWNEPSSHEEARTTNVSNGNINKKNIENNETDEKKIWMWNKFSSWGSSVINTAATSVTSFTKEVGDGLFQVLETVESGLLSNEEKEEAMQDIDSGSGVITNQDMIEKSSSSSNPVENSPSNMVNGKKITVNADDQIKDNDKVKDHHPQSSWLSGWTLDSFSNVVNKTGSIVQKTGSMVQQTTNKVVQSGLDALETISKRSFDVIGEGEQGIMKVIEKEQQPNLSEVLKEARELCELKTAADEQLLESKKHLYSYWFDEYQGLVHCEAFLLLSEESEVRVRELYDAVLDPEQLKELKRDLQAINEAYMYVICSTNNEEEDVKDHDFSELIMNIGTKLPVVLPVQKVIQSIEDTNKFFEEHHANIQEGAFPPKHEYVLKRAMQSLGQISAFGLELNHKLAQLILQQEDRLTHEQALSLSPRIVDLVKLICHETTLQSTKYIDCLAFCKISEDSDIENETLSGFIRSIFIESANSINFQHKAFKMILPVIQLCIIKSLDR